MDHEIAQEIAEGTTAVSSSHEVMAEAFYQDAKFWVAVGFVIFIVLAAKYVWPLIGRSLDKRADTIKDQLEQAARLRAEAEALLTSYQAQQTQMLKDAEDILANATRDAAEIRSKAADELKASLARRAAQAEETIARAQTQALAQLRTQLVEKATENARSVVVEQLAGQKEDPSIARALAAIEAQIH